MGKTRSRKLTDKQERFAREYVICLHAGDAAKAAGYAPANAGEQGYQQLQKPLVQRRVAELASAREKRTDITADKVLTEIYKIATADIRAAFNADGKLLPIHQIPDGVAMALSRIEVSELGVAKIRVYDKLKALELLGKHLSLFREIVEHRGLGELVERLSAANRRLRANVPPPPTELPN